MARDMKTCPWRSQCDRESCACYHESNPRGQEHLEPLFDVPEAEALIANERERCALIADETTTKLHAAGDIDRALVSAQVAELIRREP